MAVDPSLGALAARRGARGSKPLRGRPVGVPGWLARANAGGPPKAIDGTPTLCQFGGLGVLSRFLAEDVRLYVATLSRQGRHREVARLLRPRTHLCEAPTFVGVDLLADLAWDRRSMGSNDDMELVVLTSFVGSEGELRRRRRRRSDGSGVETRGECGIPIPANNLAVAEEDPSANEG